MRIVSLLPSATELAAALGLRDAIVGVSHECDFPPGVADLPSVTSSILEHGMTPAQIDAAVAAASLERKPLYLVDAELLTSLKPDLILTQGVCAVCAVTEETLAADLALLPVELACSAPVLSLTGTNYAGVRADVLAIGEAADCSDRAAALVADMDKRWDAAAAGPAPDPRPRVLMLEWPDPPWFGGHWVPEQVAAAGGADAFGTAGAPSGRTTWEQVAQADPDVIIAMACGFGLQENLEHARRLLHRPETRGLRAIREGRLWAADANALFSRPAPRIVEGAELLRAIFTGGDVDPAVACLVSA